MIPSFQLLKICSANLTSTQSMLWMRAMSKTMQVNSDPRTVFEIFRDRIGHWCARRKDGLVFGTFFERDAAVHFARHECRDANLLKLVFRAADNAVPKKAA